MKIPFPFPSDKKRNVGNKKPQTKIAKPEYLDAKTIEILENQGCGARREKPAKKRTFSSCGSSVTGCGTTNDSYYESQDKKEITSGCGTSSGCGTGVSFGCGSSGCGG